MWQPAGAKWLRGSRTNSIKIYPPTRQGNGGRKFKKNLKRTRVFAVEEDGIFLSPRRRVASREREVFFCPFVSRERNEKKKKKKEETTRVSRGWQLQFVYATFFPPVLLHDKSQRDEWATLDWSERSRPLETRSFAPLRKKTEIRRMKEKLRGQGLKVKRSKG